jgi:hypothetical protein
MYVTEKEILIAFTNLIWRYWSFSEFAVTTVNAFSQQSAIFPFYELFPNSASTLSSSDATSVNTTF